MDEVKKDSKEKSANKVKKLSEKEELFCMVYINNFNAGAAVMKAGYNFKNMANAHRYGHELLNKTHISEKIDLLKKEKLKNMKLDKNDIVKQFMKIAFSDISDYIDFGRENVPVRTSHGHLEETNPETGEKKIVKKKVNYVKFKDSTEVDGSIISQIKQGKDGSSIKLEDKLRALEWLSDYFVLNPMNKHRRDYDKKILAQRDKELEHKIQSTQETQDIISQMSEQFEEVFSKIENFAPNRNQEDFEDD